MRRGPHGAWQQRQAEVGEGCEAGRVIQKAGEGACGEDQGLGEMVLGGW